MRSKQRRVSLAYSFVYFHGNLLHIYVLSFFMSLAYLTELSGKLCDGGIAKIVFCSQFHPCLIFTHLVSCCFLSISLLLQSLYGTILYFSSVSNVLLRMCQHRLKIDVAYTPELSTAKHRNGSPRVQTCLSATNV